jgi:hypothetical protein
VTIVAPGCLHADRRDPLTKLRSKTCFRTYRTRGWCVLEIFASYLSREKSHPILCITSREGIPEWFSPLEAQKLAVGTCDFTCCQRNHKFGDRIVPCDRGITRSILETLIESKVKSLFFTNNIKYARLFRCMSQWWLRDSTTIISDNEKTLENLRQDLSWDDHDDIGTTWIDRCDISILAYAVIGNHLKAVKKILTLYNKRELVSWAMPSDGATQVGIPGYATCLWGVRCVLPFSPPPPRSINTFTQI